MITDTPTRRYFDLLEAAQHAAIVTDGEGRITYWNSAAHRLYGWTEKEVIGHQIVEITPADLSRPQAAEIMAALRAGEAWTGDFLVRTRDGRTFTASVSDIPVLNESREIVGVLGVSAPATGPAVMQAVLQRLHAACEAIWPHLVAVGGPLEPIEMAASEPHLIQLLTLLMIRNVDALDGGAAVGIEALPVDAAVAAEFALPRRTPLIWIRMGQSDERPPFSLLREMLKTTDAMPHAASLVRRLGGYLFLGARPGRPHATHLFLPRRG